LPLLDTPADGHQWPGVDKRGRDQLLPTAPRRPGWPTIKDHIDLERVLTDAPGEPVKRVGSRAAWR